MTYTPRGYYHRYMKHDLRHRAEHRTKIIIGQIKGLQKMIEADEYCMDIMTQSLAIQKSLASLNKLVLENHITTHIKQMLGSDNKTKNQQAIDELLKLYELNNIRSK